MTENTHQRLYSAYWDDIYLFILYVLLKILINLLLNIFIKQLILSIYRPIYEFAWFFIFKTSKNKHYITLWFNNSWMKGLHLIKDAKIRLKWDQISASFCCRASFECPWSQRWPQRVLPFSFQKLHSRIMDLSAADLLLEPERSKAFLLSRNTDSPSTVSLMGNI